MGGYARGLYPPLSAGAEGVDPRKDQDVKRDARDDERDRHGGVLAHDPEQDSEDADRLEEGEADDALLQERLDQQVDLLVSHGQGAVVLRSRERLREPAWRIVKVVGSMVRASFARRLASPNATRR